MTRARSGALSRNFLKIWTSFSKLQISMPASGSSKIVSWALRAMAEAISIRLSSPPERVLLTSRSR